MAVDIVDLAKEGEKKDESQHTTNEFVVMGRRLKRPNNMKDEFDKRRRTFLANE